MKYRKNMLQISLLIILTITLTACKGKSAAEPTPTEVDPVAIFTSAAATVGAQLTETALSFSPTPEPATATPTQALATATLVNLNATPLPTIAIGTAPTLLPGVPTLLSTATPITLLSTPDGPICDEMTYGNPVDISFPDGTTVKAGHNFYKIWRVYNTGVCTWDDGYKLIPIGSSSTRAGDNNPLDTPNPAWKIVNKNNFVAPGGVIDIGVHLTAPITPGEYSTVFRLQNDRGAYFGGVLEVIIVVKGD